MSSFTDRMQSSDYAKAKMTADFGKQKLILTEASGDGSDNEMSRSPKHNSSAAKLLDSTDTQNDKDKDGQEKSASEA